MLVLVTGGAASGKSAWAEARACALPGPRVYIATMLARDEEGRARVGRHRARRAPLGFATLEAPLGLAEAARRVPAGASVLLDCVGNLVANELFEPGGVAFGLAEVMAPPARLPHVPGDGRAPARGPALPAPGARVRPGEPGCVAAAVTAGALAVLARGASLVAVTNEVFSDGGRYGPGTRAYLRELAWANRMLAGIAGEAVEVAAGCALPLKGGSHA